MAPSCNRLAWGLMCSEEEALSGEDWGGGFRESEDEIGATTCNIMHVLEDSMLCRRRSCQLKLGPGTCGCSAALGGELINGGPMLSRTDLSKSSSRSMREPSSYCTCKLGIKLFLFILLLPL